MKRCDNERPQHENQNPDAQLFVRTIGTHASGVLFTTTLIGSAQHAGGVRTEAIKDYFKKMFCPKCATQNVDGASFCRVCGANISLVPQALTGELKAAQKPDTARSWRHRDRNRDRDRPPSLDEGIRSLMTGIGFLAVAIALFFFGRPVGAQMWWFWMLLPAFGMLGKGISELVRAKQSEQSLPASQPQLPYSAPIETLPPPKTTDLHPPIPSVTEGTTRHLGAEAQTRHFDSVDTQKPS